jgi:hypothetical protein
MAFPATYNFSYYRGDTNEFVIRPKNSDGSAFDLDGYSADFFIATARGAATSVVQYEAQAIVDSVNNLVTCTILPGVGEDLAPGTYVYDVQIDSGAALVYTLLTGNISVTEQVTGAI